MAVLGDAPRGLARDDTQPHRQPTRELSPRASGLAPSETVGHWASATNWSFRGSGLWDNPSMSDDYEVVFTEDRLGLTLRCLPTDEAGGSSPAPTIVKSTRDAEQRVKEGDMLISVNGQSVVALDFRDVRRLLKVTSRPIRLRFRPAGPQYTNIEYDDGTSDVAFSDIATASGSASSECSGSDARGDLGDVGDLSAFALQVEAAEPQADEGNERDDDLESHQAVQSESFGDADSTRTTENSSVLADFSDIDYPFARQSSLFSAFLRKPFRHGVDNRRIETRVGAVPFSPRVEIAFESPSKSALRVYWIQFPTSVSSHIQFARDRAMRVWRNWSGRVRRSRDNDRELTTTIHGLDYGKSYVVRVRFVFNGAPFLLSEWSVPSAAVVTAVPGRLNSLRTEFLRSTRA